MRFVVGPERDTFISLASRTVIEPGERDSLHWDLVFSGYYVQSNSGPSGPGEGAVFGPAQDLDLLFDVPPDVPFRADTAAGVLTGWFAYGNGQVYSRGHVYGIRDRGRLWKLQFISYYQEGGSERMPALYTLRYQAVDEGGVGELVELGAVDATAMGLGSGLESKAACIDLQGQKVQLLDDAQARADEAWQLCLRRTQAYLNGGYSGPGVVQAVDLDAASEESLEALARLSPESMLERFDAVDFRALNDAALSYHSDDAVRSAFGSAWVDNPGADAVLRPNVAWLVRGADAVRHYGVLFTKLEGATVRAPGTVELRVKAFSE
jgi:hypothetical protein